MKTTKVNIIKRVISFPAACALALAVAALAGAADAGRSSIGPGRVVFDLGPTGQWLSLTPDWAAGESLIAGGGFVVMAVGEDGKVVQLASTAAPGDRLVVSGRLRDRGPVYEGIPGGRRYPLDRRDDDGDGLEDEDRLDGFDNDGDGQVDEDYAAAGDQMVALSYDATDESGRPVLRFHQVNYAWTLPHIDVMVAIKLSVKNMGSASLDGVRVGAIIQSRGNGGSVVSTYDPGIYKGDGERLVSKGILLAEDGDRAVAAVFFAEPSGADDAWLTGLTTGAGSLARRVQAVVDAERGSPGFMPATPVPSMTSGRNDVADEPGRIAYGVSPDLGVLAPGEEATIYAALVAIPRDGQPRTAMDAACRTVVGDGTHRMIPPPMSLKRRAVWGTYEVEYSDGSRPTPVGATITLENARGQGVGAGDLSYLSGIDVSQLESEEQFNGDLELKLDGELFGEIAETGKTIELHGRLKNGEFVDLKLRPVVDSAVEDQVGSVSESQYWSRPGKLKPDLLNGSPNPFREETTIYYEVPSSVSDDDGNVLNFVNPVKTSVKIYNVAGRLVSILVDAILTPGDYNTSWQAVDASGNSVASGVYYVKLQIGKKHVTKRLIQLK
ncbi:MAG: T9SS type A sorting domain-containing protein [Candidatus Latescibacterota bacterium]|jgi:hypothetical protein